MLEPNEQLRHEHDETVRIWRGLRVVGGEGWLYSDVIHEAVRVTLNREWERRDAITVGGGAWFGAGGWVGGEGWDDKNPLLVEHVIRQYSSAHERSQLKLTSRLA